MVDILYWPALVVVVGLTVLLIATRGRKLRDIHLYFALFTGAISLFCLRSLTCPHSGLAADFIAVASSATCGWSWLLTRALFRPDRPGTVPWPLGLVVTMVVLTAVLRWTGGGTLHQMADNVVSLIGSTALVLALLEPLLGLRRDMAVSERRFRQIFTVAYGTIMGVSVIWVSGAPAGSWAAQWAPQVKVACALLALLAASLAVAYRGRHPLSQPQPQRPKRATTNDDHVLAARILRLMTDDKVYRRSNLKVADLARRAGEAEYKVTQCITGVLGFANANQMINHFRIEEARRMLTDPACDHLPVLTIALDCGFGSIGPFNRAFRAQLDLTPTAFRKARGGVPA